MVQLNLLPDVKLQYLKAQRQRRLIISISTLVTLVAVALMVILLAVTILQRKHITDLNNDIKTQSKSISGRENINKILTVQNQLASLTNLHATKPAASRLADYLGQVTPDQASINNLNIDFNQHQITITGTADSLATINQYVDTLKFTTYSVKGNDGSQNAFSSVVLSSFGLTQHEADYTITLNYDPTIFTITDDVTLTVPNKITTRSEVEQPTDLFKLPIDKPDTKT